VTVSFSSSIRDCATLVRSPQDPCGEVMKKQHRRVSIQSLQDELTELRARVKQLTRKESTNLFVDSLNYETKRSLRFNHFFVLAVLRCGRRDPQDVFRRVKHELRCTDIVDVIEDQKRESVDASGSRVERRQVERNGSKIAALLPETDRAGAAAAVYRLKAALPNIEDVRIGLAVYPDDSTEPAQLLKLADPMGT